MLNPKQTKTVRNKETYFCVQINDTKYLFIFTTNQYFKQQSVTILMSGMI